MKKTMLALLAISLAATATTGCSKSFHRQLEQYQQEQDRKEHSHRHHREHNRDNDERGDREEGRLSRFKGNYTAEFKSGERGPKIRVTDTAVFINGQKAEDINPVGKILVARSGYATYTIKSTGNGSWTDPDSGNSGTIYRN